jgi:ABC-type transport system involved in Fe-S cluster assembly fused permease/ATPase subunit
LACNWSIRKSCAISSIRSHPAAIYSRSYWQERSSQEGEVCIGGWLVQTLKLSDLRCHIGMVTQDVQLFHATGRVTSAIGEIFGTAQAIKVAFYEVD